MGENTYEAHHHLKQLEDEFDGTAERVDSVELELHQLPDLLAGVSLFSQKRLVIIRDLSENKAVWDKVPDWIDRMSDDIHLVIVETKPDKRTKTYKALKKAAQVVEYTSWTERDQAQAEKWLMEKAGEQNVALSPSLSSMIVARVGVDQWQLAQALDKLQVFDEIDESLIRQVIEARPSESVFELFETALKGDIARLQEPIATLRATEDPYMLFGLLSGQALQLAGLALSREGDDVAKDLGVHPYALSRLRPYAVKRGAKGAKAIVALFAEADEAMKTSPIDPWLAIEHVLFGIAAQSS